MSCDLSIQNILFRIQVVRGLVAIGDWVSMEQRRLVLGIGLWAKVAEENGKDRNEGQREGERLKRKWTSRGRNMLGCHLWPLS